MGGPTHDPRALAEFQNGEERLVYARHKSDPLAPPYYLKDGTARDIGLKAWVKEHLECLMPDCPDRRLTAVNRSQHGRRRDGFTHRQGAGKHGIEGLFHQQAKALIQAWVAETYAEVEVTPEGATQDGSRRADVMLTWPDRRRVAVEIQYAPLTVSAWLERHQSYTAQGIKPVWLLGHHGKHMRTARSPSCPTGDTAQGQVRFLLLHQAMTEHRAQVLWVNPVDRTIGTPWLVEQLEGIPDTFQVACRSDTERAFFTVDQLSACTIDPQFGLTTPAMRLLAESEAAWKQVSDQRAAEQAKAAQEQHAKELARALRLEQQRRAWQASELHRRMLDHFGGELPVQLDRVGLSHEDEIDLYPTWWHCLIYDGIIRGRRRGTRITYDSCLALLDAHQVPRGNRSRAALYAFFDHLCSHNILAINAKERLRLSTPIRILADVEGPRQVAARQARRRERDREGLEQNREHRGREGSAAETSRRTPAPSSGTSSGDGYDACLACGLGLDPVLRSSGYHFGCAPGDPMVGPTPPRRPLYSQDSLF